MYYTENLLYCTSDLVITHITSRIPIFHELTTEAAFRPINCRYNNFTILHALLNTVIYRLMIRQVYRWRNLMTSDSNISQSLCPLTTIIHNHQQPVRNGRKKRGVHIPDMSISHTQLSISCEACALNTVIWSQWTAWCSVVPQQIAGREDRWRLECSS